MWLLGILCYVQYALKCPQVESNCSCPRGNCDKMKDSKFLMASLAENDAHDGADERNEGYDGKK